AQRQALQARDEHHAAVGRLVLVLHPLPGREERQGVLLPGEGKALVAGRSVRRRGGTCRAPSAVQPLLAHGVERPRLPAGARARATASVTGARRTPCRSGPARAGTTSATWTRRTTRRFAPRRGQSTGCRSICTSAGRNMPCSICCTAASGTWC